MNQPMFLLVALALCALPCALGISCYHCTASEQPLRLCNTMSDLSKMNCSGENDTCFTVKVMSLVMELPVTAYTFGCLNDTVTVPVLNMTACTEAKNRSNVTSCTTTECDMDNCNMPAMMASSTTSATTTAAVPPSSTTAKPSAGDKIHAWFGLLFVALLALHF